MTHGPMITFRFNELSTVRGWLGGTRRPEGCVAVEGGGTGQEGEGMHTQSTAQGRVKERRGAARGGWKRNGASVNVQAPMQHNDTAKWFDHYRANITCSTELLCRAVARNIWHRY